jgi:pantoate--beta-alanine ligase
MKVFENIANFLEYRANLKSTGVGFVPTMGALHEGHASLLSRSATENQTTILSIFVNPTQFNNPDDFKHYPKTWDQDLAIAKAAGVDAIFAPRDPKEMYPDSYRYQISEKEFSKALCGEHRPGHFEGMLSVVMKLLNLVSADRAYFGEKDFQQLKLVQGMAEAFFLKTKIIGCATLREKDGLAMSSRNLRLTSDERALAPDLHRVMKAEKSLNRARELLEASGFKVEYLEDREGRRFAAANLGSVRLIDNISLGELDYG